MNETQNYFLTQNVEFVGIKSPGKFRDHRQLCSTLYIARTQTVGPKCWTH